MEVRVFAAPPSSGYPDQDYICVHTDADPLDDTVVLAMLMRTPVAYEGRRLVDTDENCMYWRYVWLLWLPIYLMIYWVPRL